MASLWTTAASFNSSTQAERALIGQSSWSLQLSGMVYQVVGHEGRNEVVAVVVARMAAQRQGLTGKGAGGFEQVWMQRVAQEFVGQPASSAPR